MLRCLKRPRELPLGSTVPLRRSRRNLRLLSGGRPVVRFAPSPTGQLHLGGLRTAIFNWLWAKSQGGTLILRIEDTDQSREVEGAAHGIVDILKWTGLDWDIGPIRQSSRLELYQRHAELLLSKGTAYRCFCPSELSGKMLVPSSSERSHACPSGHCAYLSEEDAARKLKIKTPFVIRLKSDFTKLRTVQDMVYGLLQLGKTGSRSEMDPILIKTDGFPTYHLANVVDDHDMKVTHVLRGEEWIPSLPKHLSIYEAFQWKPPQFVHLPILKSKEGVKLSKRTGSTSIESYRERGYEPEAIFNWAASMGWSHETSSVKTMTTRAELLTQFTLQGINRAQVIVDEADLVALNKRHLLSMIKQGGSNRDRLVTRIRSELVRQSASSGLVHQRVLTDQYLRDVLDIMSSRLWKLEDLLELSPYFFSTPQWSESSRNMVSTIENKAFVLTSLSKALSKLSDWTSHQISSTLEMLDHPKAALSMLRWALTATKSGPPITQIAEILGREECLSRTDQSLAALRKVPELPP